jgi:hypothetical protein
MPKVSVSSESSLWGQKKKQEHDFPAFSAYFGDIAEISSNRPLSAGPFTNEAPDFVEKGHEFSPEVLHKI